MKGVNFSELSQINENTKIDKIFTTPSHGDNVCYNISFTFKGEEYVVENIDMDRLRSFEAWDTIKAIETLDVELWNNTPHCQLDPVFLCHRYKTYSGYITLMGTTAFMSERLAAILQEEDHVEAGVFWPLWSESVSANHGAANALRVLSPEHERLNFVQTKFTVEERRLAHLSQDQRYWLADQITEGRVICEKVDERDLLDY